MSEALLRAERCTLAACLLDPICADAVCGQLEPEDFSDPWNRAVFAGIASIVRKRGALDIITLAGLLQGTAGFGQIADLMSEIVTTMRANEHAALVLAASRLRALAALAKEATDLTAGASLTVDAPSAISEALRARLDAIEHRAPGRGPRRLVDAEPDLLPRILEDTPTPQGLKTGFYKLDDWLGGLRDTEMIVLACRPSVGKSLFAANAAQHLTLREEPTPVLVFSMEMEDAALYRRFLFARAQVDARHALAGATTTRDKERLQEAHAELRTAPWFVHYEPAMTAGRISSLARRFKNKHGHCLIVVDYLQLMSAPGNSRYEQVSNMSASMKQLAGTIACPVLVLSQLNRAIEKKHGAPELPNLSDLRDSGAIEQDADVVIFLSRDITTKGPHACDVILAKNRPGRVGKTQLLFDTNGPSFKNLEAEQFPAGEKK